MITKRVLLVLSLLALLVASGVVWAAATVTTYTWLQIPVALIDPGTTWTAGGITHLRGQVIETWCYYDYDGDGEFDDGWTIVELTMNSNRDANGVGTGWGTWSEYDYPDRKELLGGGTFQGKYTCLEGQDVEEEYAYGCGDVLGWRVGPNGDWGQAKAMAILYSEPWGSDYPFVFRGAARFLVPGGE